MTNKYLPEAPEGKDWANAVAPQRLSDRHLTLVSLLALGCLQKEICEKLGMVPAHVSRLANSDIIRAEVHKLREASYNKNDVTNRKFSVLEPAAVDVYAEILHDRNQLAKLRMAAADRILDRTQGKPKQMIEATGNTIRDLIELIEATGGNGTAKHPSKDISVNVRELAPNELTLDDIDQQVRNNLGDTDNETKNNERPDQTDATRQTNQSSNTETGSEEPSTTVTSGNVRRSNVATHGETEKGIRESSEERESKFQTPTFDEPFGGAP